MRILIQRVTEAHVMAGGTTAGSIGTGLLVFLGVGRSDTPADADYLVAKLAGLRIFPDAAGKMNLSVREAGGALLVISQFTLYADCRKGRRPGFDDAAPSGAARALYEYFVAAAGRTGVPVGTGVFQAEMNVHLVNAGPVTIWIDSAERAGK